MKNYLREEGLVLDKPLKKLLEIVSFDKESGAMYVRVHKQKVAKTKPLEKDRFIDVNKSVKLIYENLVV